MDADGTLLVVDRSKKIVFRTDQQGRVMQEYGKPDTDLIDDTSDYLPCQVITDRLAVSYTHLDVYKRQAVERVGEGRIAIQIGRAGTDNIDIGGVKLNRTR